MGDLQSRFGRRFLRWQSLFCGFLLALSAFPVHGVETPSGSLKTLAELDLKGLGRDFSVDISQCANVSAALLQILEEQMETNQRLLAFVNSGPGVLEGWRTALYGTSPRDWPIQYFRAIQVSNSGINRSAQSLRRLSDTLDGRVQDLIEAAANCFSKWGESEPLALDKFSRANDELREQEIMIQNFINDVSNSLSVVYGRTRVLEGTQAVFPSEVYEEILETKAELLEAYPLIEENLRYLAREFEAAITELSREINRHGIAIQSLAN